MFFFKINESLSRSFPVGMYRAVAAKFVCVPAGISLHGLQRGTPLYMLTDSKTKQNYISLARGILETIKKTLSLQVHLQH
jgi:hypothetical protein